MIDIKKSIIDLIWHDSSNQLLSQNNKLEKKLLYFF